MTNEQQSAILNALLADKTTAEAALAMTAEQLQAALEKNGEKCTLDEVKEISAKLKEAAADAKELTSDMLDNVTGGISPVTNAQKKVFKFI